MSLCETSEMALPKQEISRIKESKELVRLLEIRKKLIGKLLERGTNKNTFPT